LEFISAPVRLPWAQKGLDGRNAGTFQGLITATPTRIRESLGTNRLFKQHIKDPQEADNLWAYLKQFDRDGSHQMSGRIGAH